MTKELKKSKLETTVDAKFIAEDWDGFQELMMQSDIQDKELILRVLSMYNDPAQREKEIKNLSAAYTKIADQILPQLRRSKLELVVDVIGKSDEQILAIAKAEPSKLSLRSCCTERQLLLLPLRKHILQDKQFLCSQKIGEHTIILQL